VILKLLITFRKSESARWLGHLDILRTFERAIRRSELPIAFTTGFNPREKIAFASALSVGVTGDEELATLEFTEALQPDSVVSRLNSKLPAGIQLTSAREIPDAGSRDLLNSFDRAEIQVVCVCPPGLELSAVADCASRLLTSTELPIQREREGKVKEVDIRPLIHEIRAEAVEGERLALTMILALGSEGTAKPQEIVGLLACDIPGISVRRVHRMRLLAPSESGRHGVQ
jgi:radical SAM-linked protein